MQSGGDEGGGGKVSVQEVLTWSKQLVVYHGEMMLREIKGSYRYKSSP